MGIMHLPWKFSTNFHALLYFSVITPFLRYILSYKNHSTTLSLWPLHINLCFLDSALDGHIPKREIKYVVTFLVKLNTFFFILWNFHFCFHWPNCKTNFTSFFLLITHVFLIKVTFCYCRILLLWVFLNACFCFWNMTEKAFFKKKHKQDLCYVSVYKLI